MLDRPKVMKELHESAEKLFINLSCEFELARTVWDSIAQDPLFADAIAASRSPWLIPSWVGMLGDTSMIVHSKTDYGVFSVDGSQIYPDRHQGPPAV